MKVGMLESIIVHTVLNRSMSWVLKAGEKKNGSVFYKVFGNMFGVRVLQKIRNRDIREKSGNKAFLLGRVDQILYKVIWSYRKNGVREVDEADRSELS